MSAEMKFKYVSKSAQWIGVLLFLVAIYGCWVIALARKLSAEVRYAADIFLADPQNSGLTVMFEGELGSPPKEFGRNCSKSNEIQQITGAPYEFTAVCPSGEQYSVVVESSDWIKVYKSSKH
ncbi:MAG: hypothetical protein KF824_01415 [Fimbriimonadaceae bacterium]|nr:MAG: hypothetical protein KF824_01415 [Fimbriimonadaceae bacterium]